MPISSISGNQAAALSALSVPGTASSANSLAALASLATGSGDSALIANMELASSGVSAALQDLTGALGSIIDTTA